MEQSLKQRIAQVLERCDDLILASVDKDGFPRSGMNGNLCMKESRKVIS